MPSARSHFIQSADGLTLHAAEYGADARGALPAVCLPGLARTAADFAPLAEALAADRETPRRVIAIDYRGRGRSGRDADPANYSYAVELADLAQVLAALGVRRAIYVGTSRGGLNTMLLAASAPEKIAGAVLNDIGPVLEPEGLLRIKGYVGKLPLPRDFSEGGEILARLFAPQFPNLTADDWRAAARLTWHESGALDGRAANLSAHSRGSGNPDIRAPESAGSPPARGRADGTAHAPPLALSYDPALAEILAGFDPAAPIPALWPQFEALAPVPVLAIRGGLSDLLSAATLAEMARRHPALEALVVPDEGHPPRLGTPEMIARIAAFMRRCDESAAQATACI